MRITTNPRMGSSGPTFLGSMFLASALVEGYLLVTDAFLRSAQPLLDAALAIFIGIDLALGLYLAGRDDVAKGLAPAWAGLQLLGLLVNPLLGFQAGMSPGAFALYLFGLWAYDALVVLRGMQLFVGLAVVGGPRRALAEIRADLLPRKGVSQRA